MEEGDFKRSVLEAIARSWNSKGFSYGVAHGLEGYPAKLGRDLDVLVAPKDVDRAISAMVRVFRDNGCSPVIHRKPWAAWVVAFYSNGGESHGIEVDIFSEMQWGWVVLEDGLSLHEDNADRGPFRLACWAGFVKRVLIQLLAGNLQRFQSRHDQLTVYEHEREVVSEKLGRFLGSAHSNAVMNAILDKDVEWLASHLGSLRRALLLQSKPSLRAVTTWVTNEVAQNLTVQRIAPIVAIVGPDGVGKSTLLSEVERESSKNLVFAGIERRHWRPGVLPQLRNFARGPYLTPKVGDAIAPRREAGRQYVLRLMYYTLDFALGYFIRDRIPSSRLVLTLYDRCFLDMVVDPLRYGFSSNVGMKRLWRWIPKPDLIILLRDDPARVHRRKPELVVREIERQFAEWQMLVEMKYVDAVIDVDAPPDVLAQRVTKLIVDAFERLNQPEKARQSGTE